MATTAQEAARAVNSFLNFSSGDQEALLEVMQDYFTSSVDPEVDELDDDDDDDDDDTAGYPLLEGIITVNRCMQSMYFDNNIKGIAIIK